MNKPKRKFSLRLKILLGVFIVGIGYFVYSTYFKTKPAKTTYQTTTVAKGTLVSTVTASGQISSANNTPVVTQVTGVITKLYVQNGDKVTAGQPIALIDLDQQSRQKYSQQYSSYLGAQNSVVNAQISLNSLKASLHSAQDTFDTAVKLHDTSGVAYKVAYDNLKVARGKLAVQDAVITQSETALTNASLSLQQISPTITAPLSGVISSLALQVGSVIPAQAVSSSSSNQISSQNIAVVTTSQYPIVTINLSEIDIPKIKIGNRAIITLDAFPDKTFTGKIFSINTTGSVSSGVTTYPTTITFDTENPGIYANMSANATIIVDTRDNVLMVPTSAIQTQNGQTVVRILVKDQLTYLPVELGLAADSETEILSGLNEGESIVTAVITTSTSKTTTPTTSPFSAIRGGGFGGNARPGR